MEIYEPREDSFLIQKYVSKYAKGVVLDLGTGTGILAEEAAKSKKVVKVFGVDINEEAVIYCIKHEKNFPTENLFSSSVKFKTSLNFMNHQKSKKIIYAMSDMFTLFKRDRRYIGIKFDTILFNPPYLPTDPKHKDVALDGGKKGYELICKFLHGCKRFLKPKGKILLVFSSLTGKEKLDKFLLENYWKYRLLEKKHVFFEDLYLYLIENER